MAKKNIEISVEEKLRPLYDLQYIDSRLDEIRSTRGELPIEVEDLQNEIEGLNKRLSKIEMEISELHGEINNKKEAANHSQTLIDKYKSQQDNVRNNKEFEAKISHKNEVLNENKAKLEELESHLNFKKSELDGLIAETQKEEEFLVKKSEEFAALIDERLLSSYRRIRNNSANGLAVVGIERGAPKGSYFTIPAQKLVEIAQRKKIIIDEHSGKILVDDELVNEENAKMEEIIRF